MQNRLIAFCYLFLVGIVAAMLLPVDASLLSVIQIVTAVSILAAAMYFVFRHREQKAGYSYERMSTRILGWLLVVLAAVALGYGRYIDSNNVPDSRLAEIVLSQEGAALNKSAELDDTSRLRIRKIEQLDSDVKLRIKGELLARVPITSDDGQPQMDEKGRWRFSKVKKAYASDIIVISKDDPVGTDYKVPQPFNSISGVEILEGPSSGKLSVYRMSNHIASFVRMGMRSMPVTILGKISQDPWVYDFKTVLHFDPAFIQYRPDGPFYKVEGGAIRANLDTRVTGYNRFARSEGYGYDVVVTSPLFESRPQSNPGDFDQRAYLHKHNIYGQMSLRQARGQLVPPIVAVAPEGGDLGQGHPLVRVSLKIRDDMLRVIKQTMPYPNSAMLGAVTLGLRYGLQGTECLFSSVHGEPPFGHNCDLTIADEFKHSGVNHVLAVSGLHVTIIMLLFMGIFSLMKISKRVFVPIVVLILVIFAIITGARPSTLRAVIMNSLFLLTWGYLDKGLVSSALLGVPVAAFLILYHNPLMIVDPSFTLSFMAILSLVLITGPVYKILSLLRGNSFLLAILILAAITATLMTSWSLVTSIRFWIPFVLLSAAMSYGVRMLNKKGIKLFGNVAYIHIPVVVGTLIASQAAIQGGMMAPLSAAYFSRWAAGGSYANLLALPLIGVVVQLSVMAGLLGQIPIIGGFIALLLNGANWLCSTGFLWLAHFSTEMFPFPFVRKISPTHLLLYYLILAVFIWHEALWLWLKGELARKKGKRALGYSFIGLLVVLLVAACATRPHYDHGDDLNITMLSVNYGSALLIETPQDKKFLIDAGMVERERGRFNTAERTILPYFSYKSLLELDGLIVTSPNLERAAGAGYILKYIDVNTLYLPPSMRELKPDMPQDEFYAQILEGNPSADYQDEFLQAIYDEMIGSPLIPKRLSLARAIKEKDTSFVNRWAGSYTKQQTVQAGEIIYEEMNDGKRMYIEVLNPADDTPAADRPIENKCLVLRIVYGEFSMLVTGNLFFDGQKYLIGKYSGDELVSDIMVAPHHGTAALSGGWESAKESLLQQLDTSTALLLDQVKPDKVLFDYGNPGPVYKQNTRDARNTHAITYRYYEDKLGTDNVLSTEKDLAIFIQSDGQSYQIETQAEKVTFGGDAAEAVSSLEVGF